MPPGIKSAAIGGGICLALFLISALIIRGGMGWGDVKLAILIGIITGYELIFIAILFAAISGCIFFVVLLLLKKKARKDSIPFGPFLALGAVATLLWGGALLEKILELAGRGFGG
jgi:leader peptidase (prepilin peptidase)/N-methyltransferase